MAGGLCWYAVEPVVVVVVSLAVAPDLAQRASRGVDLRYLAADARNGVVFIPHVTCSA